MFLVEIRTGQGLAYFNSYTHLTDETSPQTIDVIVFWGLSSFNWQCLICSTSSSKFAPLSKCISNFCAKIKPANERSIFCCQNYSRLIRLKVCLENWLGNELSPQTLLDISLGTIFISQAKFTLSIYQKPIKLKTWDKLSSVSTNHYYFIGPVPFRHVVLY